MDDAMRTVFRENLKRIIRDLKLEKVIPKSDAGYSAKCSLCSYEVKGIPYRDMAGCYMTWHIWDKHPKDWVEIMGDRVPTDPNPNESWDPWAGGARGMWD